MPLLFAVKKKQRNRKWKYTPYAEFWAKYWANYDPKRKVSITQKRKMAALRTRLDKELKTCSSIDWEKMYTHGSIKKLRADAEETAKLAMLAFPIRKSRHISTRRKCS